MPGYNWMGAIPTKTKLFDLVIPGTHNSHSYDIMGVEIVASCIVRCQGDSITDQLKMGVRCIDLRLCYYDNDWYCSHGVLTIHLNTALK